jgi:SpoIID/LytB domain protein
MCQVGAYGMARAGLGYEQILKNYYTGIDLTKMY